MSERIALIINYNIYQCTKLTLSGLMAKEQLKRFNSSFVINPS